MTQVVIDIPASLTTAIPSSDTLATIGMWLLAGVALVIFAYVLENGLDWLGPRNHPKTFRKNTKREPLTWLPKKYVPPDHR